MTMQLFDAHFHIINHDYPIVENQGYTPDPFFVSDYLKQIKPYDLVGGCVVSGSFQAFDTDYLIHALEALGPSYVGVANIPITVPDEQIIQLSKANITGVRFNLKRGGPDVAKNMVQLADRLYQDYGWNVELYVDSKDLKALEVQLKQLPPFSIDHLGLSRDGLNELYKWCHKGAKVKATGFGRLDFEVIPVMKRIYDLNPNALMFGTDLPSTRAPRPFSDDDVQLIKAHFDETAQKRIFYENAREWYANRSTP